MARALLVGGAMRLPQLLFVSVALATLVASSAACGGKAFEDRGDPSSGGTPQSGNPGTSAPAMEPARTKASFCVTAERSSMEIELFQLITPTPPADYLALRRLTGGFDEPAGGREVLTDAERGERCKTASDRTACEKRYKGIPLDELFYSYVFFTRGDDVGKIQSATSAMKLIGVVDSPEDAFFVAWQSGFWPTCAGEASAQWRQVGDAYEIVTQQGGCNAPVERVVVSVHRDGTIEGVSRTKISDETGCQ